jgi:hypothetical protein
METITFTAFNHVGTIDVLTSITVGELKVLLEEICSTYTIVSIKEKTLPCPAHNGI